MSWLPQCLLWFQCKFYFSQSSAIHLLESFLYNSHHFILKYFIVNVKYDSQKFLLGHQNFSFIPALLSSVPYQNRLNELSFITEILLLYLGMTEPWILYQDNINQVKFIFIFKSCGKKNPCQTPDLLRTFGKKVYISHHSIFVTGIKIWVTWKILVGKLFL